MNQNKETLFYCPVYEDVLSQKNCDVLSYGAEHGHLLHDDSSAVLPMDIIAERKDLCLNCSKSPVMLRNAQLNQAIIFATERHAQQLRKGTAIPYILHPLETMQILCNMHADTNLMIAGLLHDTIEDTNTTAAEITALFGEEVAILVNHHSEDKSKLWLERKTQAIQTLKTADLRLKMLVMADKLSNMRSIARDYEDLGDALWARFNAPKEKQAWYYNGILDALSELQEYDDTADAYWELTERYKDVFVIYKINPTYDKLYQANTFGEAYCLTKGNPQWMPVTYRFRQNDIPLTRQEAESLEDKWYDLFLNVVETDLQDGTYPLFHGPNYHLQITLEAGQLTFSRQVPHNNASANIVDGNSEPELFYKLNEDAAYQFLSQLRVSYGIAAPLAQILLQVFGKDNGAAIFQTFCEDAGIDCSLYSV